MAIVCGKCGSRNVYVYQGFVAGEGFTGRSLSCVQCGNNSESSKYGFMSREQWEEGYRKMGKFTQEGICGNCGRARLIIKGMGICFTCQQAAQKKRGPERTRALEDIKEKILRGDPVTRKSAKSRKVEGNPKTVIPASPPVIPAEAGSQDNGHVITLLFLTDADCRLLEAIREQAHAYRRTVDQQILWLCQNEVKLHAELLKEEEAGHGV